MAEVISNITNVNELIIPIVTELFNKQFSWIITLIQAVGILFLIYIVYIIFTAIFEYKKRSQIKRIEKKLDQLDKKMNRLLKRLKK